MERDKIKNDLLNAGVYEVQSEAMSYLFAQMATKEDLRELRKEMMSEFRVVRADLGGEIHSVRTELLAAIEKLGAQLRGEGAELRGELRREIAESARETMETMVGFQNKLFMMTLGLIGALTAIFTAIQLILG